MAENSQQLIEKLESQIRRLEMMANKNMERTVYLTEEMLTLSKEIAAADLNDERKKNLALKKKLATAHGHTGI
ncbi:unnamed protein product [Caenorhabditis sp. 36 PRJEB53466]|nr:unnamed protein product [Caenorhabditis sp. 36 PRJEB53466]